MIKAFSNEQLMKVAPSIFAAEPWEEVSSKYTFIPTIQVVDALRSEGFFPVRAAQSKARIEGKRNFTMHMLRFRRESHTELTLGNEIPELVLVNSHDRTSSFQLSAGIYRVVCSNGLTVQSANLGGVKVQHSGSITDRVIEGSYRVIEEMPAIMDKIGELKSVTLNREEQQVFASSALKLRYPGEAPIQPDRLLMERRYNDVKPDLWTTFNRVQENMMRGGIRGKGATGRTMTTHKITAVSEDIRLNKALWALAEGMAALKH